MNGPKYESRITLGNYIEIAVLLIGLGAGYKELQSAQRIVYEQITQDRDRLTRLEAETARLATQYVSKERLDAERRYLIQRLDDLKNQLTRIEAGEYPAWKPRR